MWCQMLPTASSGNAAAGLKYLYNSQSEDIVPRSPTDPIESFCAHKIPAGAQLIAMPKSAVNPTTETISRFCRLLICFKCKGECSVSLLLWGMPLSTDWVLDERIMKLCISTVIWCQLAKKLVHSHRIYSLTTPSQAHHIYSNKHPSHSIYFHSLGHRLVHFLFLKLSKKPQVSYNTSYEWSYPAVERQVPQFGSFAMKQFLVPCPGNVLNRIEG